MNYIDIKIKNISNNDLPTYADPGSSGMDIRAYFPGSFDYTYIMPGETRIIGTGIFLEIPEEYEIQIRSRSGLAAKYSIAVLNSPGTIDSSYKDEIKVILHNFGEESFKIENGDRIAQMVLQKVDPKIRLLISESIDTSNDRGGGLGHTGIK